MVSGHVHLSPTFDDQNYSLEKYPQLLTCKKPLMVYLNKLPGQEDNEITVVLSRLEGRLTSGAARTVIYGGRFDLTTILGDVSYNVQLTLQDDYRLFLHIRQIVT